MKKVVFGTSLAFLVLLSSNVMAGTNVWNQMVTEVYLLEEPHEIEFFLARDNGCGGSIYRVEDKNTDSLNRKYDLLARALTYSMNLSFYDKGVCEGSRRMVGWIRVKK